MMRSKGVRDLQEELKEHGYYHAAVDGVFGEYTAQSVFRAKFWLGYNHPNTYAGARLLGILAGTGTTTKSERVRATLRRRKARQVSIGARLLNEARTHLGTKESPPQSNKVVFSYWYGLIGSWCAMFISYCGVRSKSKVFQQHVRYAYVPFIVADARAGRNGLVLVHASNVRPGDLVCYDWPGESPGVADHIGVFEKWIVPGVDFHAIEGNTAVGNDSNGGEVMRRVRNIHNVQIFARVTR
jgi:hypothetical protein